MRETSRSHDLKIAHSEVRWWAGVLMALSLKEAQNLEAESIYPEVLADRYELRELISHGGMSAVFRCIDRVINSECAIKLLSLEEILSQKGRERFEQECQMLMHFDHPNVIHNLDYGIYDDIPFLVMELCVDKQGRPFTLRQYQQQCEGGKVAWDDLQDVFAQLVRGLSLFHQHGLVHRDIKPENILLQVSKDDRLIPKLIDFGLVAVSCDVGMGQRMQLSTPVEQQPLNSKQINGTLKFMSPEQLDGDPVSASSDVYSLGVSLFNLMTDKEHPNVAPKAWSKTDAPDWLTELLFASLQEDPAMRPQDANAMWDYFPEDVQERASTREELDRDAPTKHQVKLDANTILLGDPIQGRFQVLEETGQHSGVSWFMCRDLSSGDMLSIRLIPYDRERDQDCVDDFEHRCRELMKVEHPNLIKIIDCGVDTSLGQTYLVTELIPDGESGPMTLRDLVRSKVDKRLSWREVCHYAPQISGALAVLHSNGITHGQLSPRNILLTEDDDGKPQTKLMGFADCEVFDSDLIRFLPQFNGLESSFGRAGEEAGFVCDYDFMSPEQRNGDAYDPQTDAYALGRTLYYMATGYERLSVAKPTEINPELPGWVDDVCEHCLEEDRERRIESVLLAEHLIPEDIRAGANYLLEDAGEKTDTIHEVPPARVAKPLIIDTLPSREEVVAKAVDKMGTRMETRYDPEVYPEREGHIASREKPEIADSQEEVASTLSISLKSDAEDNAAVKRPTKSLGITRPPPPKAGAYPEESVEDEVAAMPRRVELPKIKEVARPVQMPKANSKPTLKVLDRTSSPSTSALVPLGHPAEPIALKGRRKRRSWFNRWKRRNKRLAPAIIIVAGVLVSLLVCLFFWGMYLAVIGQDQPPDNAFARNCEKAESYLKKENYPAALRCAEDAQIYARDDIEEQRQALELLKRVRESRKLYEARRRSKVPPAKRDGKVRPGPATPPSSRAVIPETAPNSRTNEGRTLDG